MFSNLSSQLIYPPGLLRLLECQVLVDVGREYTKHDIFCIQILYFKNVHANALKPIRTTQMTLGDLLSHLVHVSLPNPLFVNVL
jgi:hypothetical protein